MATQPHTPPAPQPPAGDSAGVGPVALGALAQVATGLKALMDTDWAQVVTTHSTEVVQHLEQILRTTTALQADVLAATQSSGMWALGGQRKFDTWLSNTTGTTRGTAGKAVRLSKSLHDDLPATREALADGIISSDHAAIISQRCTKTARQRKKLTHPRRGEKYLIDQAQQMDATKFARVVKAWAIEADPGGASRHWREEGAKEELSVTTSGEGYYLSGYLNQVHGALLDEALRSHMGRKAAGDTRSYNQRCADGLVALASQSLTFGKQLPAARIRPHLVVTVDYTTLAALVAANGPLIPDTFSGDTRTEAAWAAQWRPGDDHLISTSLDYSKLRDLTPATLPNGTPIPHHVLARLACESMLTRVVFGPYSTVLNVGRDQRIFTKPQTRAIIARDRHCQYPGCDEGPTFGEIHHSISWARHNGNTDVDLGILLCFHHHDLVHEREITIIRRQGEWIFTDRHGHPIAPPAHHTNSRAIPAQDRIADAVVARIPKQTTSTSARTHTPVIPDPPFTPRTSDLPPPHRRNRDLPQPRNHTRHRNHPPRPPHRPTTAKTTQKHPRARKTPTPENDPDPSAKHW